MGEGKGYVITGGGGGGGGLEIDNGTQMQCCNDRHSFFTPPLIQLSIHKSTMEYLNCTRSPLSAFQYHKVSTCMLAFSYM